MSKIHIGPHTDLRHDPDAVGAAEHPATEQFDREISLRGIVWTVVATAGITVLSAIVVWFILAGFKKIEDKRQPEPSPLAEAHRVEPPPEPRLQTAAEEDLRTMRTEEDVLLHAGWVNQAQGTVHVPIDVAMDVIASRGLGPEVVGGTPGAGAATPPATPEGGPVSGANVQMSRQPETLETAATLPPSERR